MYYPKNNENVLKNVSYIFSKFNGFSQIDCDVICGSTQSYFHTTMVTHYLNLHVQPLPNVTPTVTTTFDLWMSKGHQDTLPLL